MKLKTYAGCIILSMFSALPMRVFADDTAAIVGKVELFPVGSFDLTAQSVLGKGVKKGSKYSAEELKVAVESLETGISLRDSHLKDKLQAKKFPHVVVKDVQAENGKGKAKITIMEITKEINFEFKDLGNNLAEATFKLNLPDFKISGINFKGVGVEDEIVLKARVPYESL